MLGELYCDGGVLLWPAMGRLVGLSFFEVSSNFCLVEAWTGGFGLSICTLKCLPLAFLRSLLIPPQKDESRCLQQI